jgi:hypothetical protein
MRLCDLAECIGARVLTHPNRAACVQIERAFAGNQLGELLAKADRVTLLVSALNNSHLARVADLTEAPGICLVGGATANDDLLRAASDSGCVLLVARGDLEEMYRRLRQRGIPCGGVSEPFLRPTESLR